MSSIVKATGLVKRYDRTLQDVFADRKVVGVSSKGALGAGEAGGGSFHCITQQEPV